MLEFGAKNDMPHLHVLIDRIHFNKEDIEWTRKLWQKHVGKMINVRQIRDAHASSYVLKYLQKTFDKDGTPIYEGNAWCYWITNSNFYSVSLDIQKQMISPLDRLIDEFNIEMWGPYADVIAEVESSRFEYIGTVPLSVLGSSPPDVLSDQWLYESGFLYSDIYDCWYYAGVGDRN